jgi:hypothetical protein
MTVKRDKSEGRYPYTCPGRKAIGRTQAFIQVRKPILTLSLPLKGRGRLGGGSSRAKSPFRVTALPGLFNFSAIQQPYYPIPTLSLPLKGRGRSRRRFLKGEVPIQGDRAGNASTAVLPHPHPVPPLEGEGTLTAAVPQGGSPHCGDGAARSFQLLTLQRPHFNHATAAISPSSVAGRRLSFGSGRSQWWRRCRGRRVRDRP